MNDGELREILKEIENVLGYGGAWDAHTYLCLLRDSLKAYLE